MNGKQKSVRHADGKRKGTKEIIRSTKRNRKEVEREKRKYRFRGNKKIEKRG